MTSSDGEGQPKRWEPRASSLPAVGADGQKRRMRRSGKVPRVGLSLSMRLEYSTRLDQIRERIEEDRSMRIGLGRVVEVLVAWFESESPSQDFIDEVLRG